MDVVIVVGRCHESALHNSPRLVVPSRGLSGELAEHLPGLAPIGRRVMAKGTGGFIYRVNPNTSYHKFLLRQGAPIEAENDEVLQCRGAFRSPNAENSPAEISGRLTTRIVLYGILLNHGPAVK